MGTVNIFKYLQITLLVMLMKHAFYQVKVIWIFFKMVTQ